MSSFLIWIIIIDYLLGVVMWTLIGRFGMSLFLNENSDFFFMKVFVKFTDPIQKFFNPVTLGFLIPRLIPLYVAWFIFIFRFYIFPLALGYSVMGILSFLLGSEVSKMIYDRGIFLGF